MRRHCRGAVATQVCFNRDFHRVQESRSGYFPPLRDPIGSTRVRGSHISYTSLFNRHRMRESWLFEGPPWWGSTLSVPLVLRASPLDIS